MAGEGGGKTALLSALARLLPGRHVVWYRPAQPPFVPSLDSLLRDLVRSLGESIPAFPSSEVLPLLSLEPAHTRECVAKLLGAIGKYSDSPVLIVIDDEHLLEGCAASRAFLGALCDTLLSSSPDAYADKVSLVLASRDTPSVPLGATLGEAPLRCTLEEIDAFANRFSPKVGPVGQGAVGAVSSTSSRAAIAARIRDLSGGNPRMVGMLWRLLAGASPAEVARIEQTLNSSTDRLGTVHRLHFRARHPALQALMIAASVTPWADGELVAHFAAGITEGGVTAADGTARELAAAFDALASSLCFAGHLVPCGAQAVATYVWSDRTLRFLAELRSEECLPHEVQRFHRWAAAAYVARNAPLVAGRHLIWANDDCQAVQVLESGIPGALKDLRLTEVDEALAMLPEGCLDRSSQLLLCAADLRRRQGRPQEAFGYLATASARALLSGDDATRAEALYALAQCSLEAGDVGGMFARAMTELGGMDTADARLDEGLAMACLAFATERYGDAHAIAVQVIADADTSETHYPDCLSFLIATSLAAGDIGEATRILGREVALRRARGEIRGLADMIGIGNSVWLVCLCLYAQGDTIGLESLLTQIQQAPGNPVQPQVTAVSWLVWAFTSIVKGDYSAAFSWLKAAAAWTNHGSGISAFTFNDEVSLFLLREMLHTCLRLGELPLARACVTRIVHSDLVRKGRSEYRHIAMLDEAEVLLLDGDAETAMALADESMAFQVRTSRHVERVGAWALKARAASHMGDAELAGQYTAEAVKEAYSKRYAYLLAREFGRLAGVPVLADALTTRCSVEEALFAKEAVAVYAPECLKPLTQALRSAKARAPGEVRSGGDSRGRQAVVRTPAASTREALRPVQPEAVRVRAFGELEARLPNGQLASWRKSRAKALLAMLLDADGQRVSKEQLAEILWPEGDPTGSRNGLRNVLCFLRGALMVEGAVGSDRQALWVVPSIVRWDVPEFVSATREARSIRAGALSRPPDARQLARVETLAAKLKTVYRGEYIDEPTLGHLFVERRSRYRGDYAESMCGLGEVALVAGQAELASDCFSAALTVEPFLEPAHRGLMRLYWARGDREAALHQYRSCRDRIRAELGVAPEPDTTDLYRAITAGGKDPELPKLSLTYA